MEFNYSDEIPSASTLLGPAPASLIRFLCKAPSSWVRQKALSNQQYFRPLQDKRCKCNQLLVTGHELKSAQQKHQAAAVDGHRVCCGPVQSSQALAVAVSKAGRPLGACMPSAPPETQPTC